MSIYVGIKPKIIGVKPSSNIQHRNDTERLSNSTSPTKIKEIVNLVAGVWRVEFKLRTTNSAGTAYGQIYRNGSPYGTLRSTTSTTYVTFQEDLPFQVGDFIQLYVYISNSAYYVVTKELRLLGDFTDIPAYNSIT